MDGEPVLDEPAEPGELEVPGEPVVPGAPDEPGGEVVVLAREELPEGVPPCFAPEDCPPDGCPPVGAPEVGPPGDGRDGVESVATDVAP